MQKIGLLFVKIDVINPLVIFLVYPRHSLQPIPAERI